MTTRPGISSTKNDLGISMESLYRLSVAQYHALADAGILDEDDPVELLEGWLVCKYGPFEAPASRILPPSEESPAEEALGLTLAWIWRFSVDQYHAMADAGILTEEDPVELLGGWLIRKMTQKPEHPVVVDLVRDAFASRLFAGGYVRTQAPVTLAGGEPEPDVVLVRGARREFLRRHPGPDEIALVAEIADTSLARDRGVKRQMYAQAGIPIYWIVNLIDRRIEVYTEPASGAEPPEYGQRRDYEVSEVVPVVIDGVEAGHLAVQEVLP
jgi:Uma2 family endonuclease